MKLCWIPRLLSPFLHILMVASSGKFQLCSHILMHRCLKREKNPEKYKISRWCFKHTVAFWSYMTRMYPCILLCPHIMTYLSFSWLQPPNNFSCIQVFQIFSLSNLLSEKRRVHAFSRHNSVCLRSRLSLRSLTIVDCQSQIPHIKPPCLQVCRQI